MSLYQDLLIAQSTSPDFTSERHRRKGSLFIGTFVKAFYTHAHREHALTILTKVWRPEVARYGFPLSNLQQL